MAKNLACRKTFPLPGPFPGQAVEADTEIDRRVFMFQFITHEKPLLDLAQILSLPEVNDLKSKAHHLEVENVQLNQEILHLKQELMALKQKN